MKFDAIVIGSGQAGNPLVHNLADRGWHVALIEEKNLGGTCINTGCTPTKVLVHRAQVAHYARDAARWGVNTSGVSVDLPKIIAQKDQVVLGMRGNQEQQTAKRPKIRLYRGHATFLSNRQLRVGEELLESEKIFINTGGRPVLPAIKGLNDVPYLTNESLLQLQSLPEHLAVLGGGYVGLEFAQMFRRFGSQVTVIHSGPRILAREDSEITAELQKALRAEGIEFLLGARTTAAAHHTGGTPHQAIELSVDIAGQPTKVSASHLLVATGRAPNTDSLGLENTGVQRDEHGYIQVNGKLETAVPGIWALGDAKGGPAFTHISYNDFQVVFGNVVEGKDLSIDHRIVPYCVFTDPQLGGVGLTEQQAREQGYQLKIGKYPMTSVARAIERDETAGMMKLIVNAANDQILGASILASEGGETVQILHTLMLAKQPYTLLKGAIYIHPTLAEGFFGLMQSVKPVD